MAKGKKRRTEVQKAKVRANTKRNKVARIERAIKIAGVGAKEKLMARLEYWSKK